MSFSTLIVPTLRAGTELIEAINYRLCAKNEIKHGRPVGNANKMAVMSGVLALSDGACVILHLTTPAIAPRVELACLPLRVFIGAAYIYSDNIYYQISAFSQTMTALEGVKKIGLRTGYVTPAKYLNNTLVTIELIARIFNSITLTFLSR